MALLNERAKKGDVDLLFIGDSITEAWEHAGREVWEKYYGKRKAFNIGFGGDQTQHVLWRLEHGNIDGIDPKVAVVMIGTNNINAGHSVEQIVDGLEAIVAKLHEKLPRTHILLLGIFPRDAAKQDPGRIRAAEITGKVARLDDGKWVHILDTKEYFVDANGNIPSDVMPGFLHLSAKGYQVWPEAIEDKLARLMNDEPYHVPAGSVAGQVSNSRVKKAVEAIEELGGFVLADRDGRIVAVDLSRRKEVADADLSNLRRLKHLKVLGLEGTSITDAGLLHLRGLESLEWLNLSGTKITDAGMRNLSSLSNLDFLYMGGTRIDGAGVAYLKGLKKLSFITFWDSTISDVSVEHLVQLKQLRELYLGGYSGGTRVSKEGVRKIQKALKNCAIIH